MSVYSYGSSSVSASNGAPLHSDPDVATLMKSIPGFVPPPGKEMTPMAAVVAYLKHKRLSYPAAVGIIPPKQVPTSASASIVPSPAAPEPAYRPQLTIFITPVEPPAEDSPPSARDDVAELCGRLSQARFNASAVPFATSRLDAPASPSAATPSPLVSPLASPNSSPPASISRSTDLSTVSPRQVVELPFQILHGYDDEHEKAKIVTQPPPPPASVPTPIEVTAQSRTELHFAGLQSTATSSAAFAVTMNAHELRLPILPIHAIKKVSLFSHRWKLNWHLGLLDIAMPRSRIIPTTEPKRASENEKLMHKLALIEDFLKRDIHYYPMPGLGNTKKYVNALAIEKLMGCIQEELTLARRAFDTPHSLAIDAIIASIGRLTADIDRKHEAHVRGQIRHITGKSGALVNSRKDTRNIWERKWEEAGKRNDAQRNATQQAQADSRSAAGPVASPVTRLAGPAPAPSAFQAPEEPSEAAPITGFGAPARPQTPPATRETDSPSPVHHRHKSNDSTQSQGSVLVRNTVTGSDLFERDLTDNGSVRVRDTVTSTTVFDPDSSVRIHDHAHITPFSPTATDPFLHSIAPPRPYPSSAVPYASSSSSAAGPAAPTVPATAAAAPAIETLNGKTITIGTVTYKFAMENGRITIVTVMQKAMFTRSEDEMRADYQQLERWFASIGNYLQQNANHLAGPQRDLFYSNAQSLRQWIEPFPAMLADCDRIALFLSPAMTKIEVDRLHRGHKKTNLSNEFGKAFLASGSRGVMHPESLDRALKQILNRISEIVGDCGPGAVPAAQPAAPSSESALLKLFRQSS